MAPRMAAVSFSNGKRLKAIFTGPVHITSADEIHVQCFLPKNSTEVPLSRQFHLLESAWHIIGERNWEVGFWGFQAACLENQLVNLIGTATPWSAPEMSPRNQTGLFLRPGLETGVSGLPSAKAKVTGIGGQRGTEMSDLESAACQSRGRGHQDSPTLDTVT